MVIPYTNAEHVNTNLFIRNHLQLQKNEIHKC